MRKILTLLVLSTALCACGHSNPKVVTDNVILARPSVDAVEKGSADAPAEAKMAMLPPPENDRTTAMDTSKKVIKTGEMSFEVENLGGARKKILLAVRKLNGYIAEENQSNENNGRMEYELKIRVPAKNFDRLLDSVSGSAKRIDTKDITKKDVTTEFIDFKAQLANSRALEDTYLNLLKRAGKMSDVLQIESKITEIRTQIDSTQGVFNYLRRQTELATLDMTFYTQPVAQESDNSIWSKFKSSLGDGWTMLQGLFFGLISIWPLVLLLPLIFWAFRRWRKIRRHSRQPVSS